MTSQTLLGCYPHFIKIVISSRIRQLGLHVSGRFVSPMYVLENIHIATRSSGKSGVNRNKYVPSFSLALSLYMYATSSCPGIAQTNLWFSTKENHHQYFEPYHPTSQCNKHRASQTDWSKTPLALFTYCIKTLSGSRTIWPKEVFFVEIFLFDFLSLSISLISQLGIQFAQVFYVHPTAQIHGCKLRLQNHNGQIHSIVSRTNPKCIILYTFIMFVVSMQGYKRDLPRVNKFVPQSE